MKIINLSKGTVLADNAKMADNSFLRLKGLLGESGLGADCGLILKPCSSIHTFFMRFAIDAAFVDRQNRIIKIYSQLKPWRLSAIFPNSHFCLELPSGTFSATQTQAGDQIQIFP